ncbi:helix-turn-helix transcriptional regulator [Bacillus sp. S13(2024)]|uniref:helix-turn-helix domain-containing protein n=1 Tax=Bacillus sp. S13(2024) TaxID=3162885 RepID=UPI003D2468DD
MFHIRLKQIRKERGLTQEALAVELNKRTGNTFSKTTISNYETEVSSPSIEILLEIGLILNVSIDYLLGRVDNPKSHENVVYMSEESKQKISEAIEILKEISK